MRWLLLCSSLIAQAAVADGLAGRVAEIGGGDALTILDAGERRHKVRVADIDAPKMDQPFGTRSTKSLADLCLGKHAAVEDAAPERDGRTIGRVSCAGVDAAKAQVRLGMAWVYRRYAPRHSVLYGIENEARIRRRGLWADPDPVPPWEWRGKR
jgi:endonuclease YncB( thermonuclease family)